MGQPLVWVLFTAKVKSTIVFRNGEVSRETPEKSCNCTKVIVDGSYSGHESQQAHNERVGRKTEGQQCHLLDCLHKRA